MVHDRVSYLPPTVLHIFELLCMMELEQVLTLTSESCLFAHSNRCGCWISFIHSPNHQERMVQFW